LGNYSIKDLETLSGIKAHTLRIWEQRYNIIEPKRTETNIRFYNDDDLKRILNISLLNQNGYKISKIASMSTVDINHKILDLSQDTLNYPDHVHNLMVSMMEMDELGFEKNISKCILQFGLEKTMIHIVYPFFNKVGLLWQIGTISPYQEHFISNLIRQKIIVAIDGQNNTLVNPLKYLLFLPDSELHEIGLLFASYILKNRGFKVFYFGQSLPFEDLIEACKTSKPDCTFTIMTSLSLQEAELWTNRTANEIPDIKHIVSSHHLLPEHVRHPNIYISKSVESFIHYLDSQK